MIFTLEPLTPGRYRATNTLTGVAHVTYGTEAEVVEQLERQSAVFEARTKNKRGSWKRSRGDQMPATAGKPPAR